MPRIPKVITHKELPPLLQALQNEPEFALGSKTIDPDAWYRQTVILEVCCGELCKDGLSTLAIVGRHHYETVGLTGKEGFSAQGLEGKALIRKDLFSAMMNLRDIVPEFRGRIVTR